MASIFSKNGILSNRIDHYCLVCAKKFMNEKETLAHIIDSQHEENWKACGYCEKYKEDFIRKAKDVYFCELCNLTFPTTMGVKFHLEESDHIKAKIKTGLLFKFVGDEIVGFNQFITDDAWNGYVDDHTCVLCNIEFDDRSSHKATQSHILNLINSEIRAYNSTGVYRQINNNARQCLNCNIIYRNYNFSCHMDTSEHKGALKKYDLKHSTQTFSEESPYYEGSPY